MILCLTQSLIFCLFTTIINGKSPLKHPKEKSLKHNFDEYDPENPEDNPFRMQKVKLLWEKGLKRLQGRKLSDLYADLKIHDLSEARLKKLKVTDMDKNGEKESQVLSSYRHIVEYYGLDNNFGKATSGNEIPDDDYKNVHFQDPKLRTMWGRAEVAGFSEEDLEMLREEFMHQQMKIEEFEYLKRELADVENIDDNDVEPRREKEGMPKKELKEKKLLLKDQHKDIRDGYLRLNDITSQLDITEPEFRDSRVYKLWAVAKKTNWTEQELNSFKEELKHFEHRLSKQDYYLDQLRDSERVLKTKLKEGEDYPEKHFHLQEKNKEISQKVKKLHIGLKAKLDKALKHIEL